MYTGVSVRVFKRKELIEYKQDILKWLTGYGPTIPIITVS